MKLHLRSLLLACSVVVAAAAHANDDSSSTSDDATSSPTEYYLRCKTIEDKLKWYTDNLRESFKFTQIGTTNEYQLAVEYLNDDFYIGDKDSDKVLLGSVDAVTLNSTEAMSDNGETFALSPNGTNSISWPWENAWTKEGQIQHLLFTLTVDGENSTLKVEPITNKKLKPGVPSFWYLTINDETLYPANRFIKENDEDGYYVHFDSLSGILRIMDGPCLYGNGGCMLLTSDNTTTLLKYDTVKNSEISNYEGTDNDGYTTGLFYEICGAYITTKLSEKKYILITKDTDLDKYSYALNVYEDNGNAAYIRLESYSGAKDITYKDVTLHFKYDIATHTDDTVAAASDEETTTYSDYELKLSGDKKDYEGLYNGVLTLEVGGIEGLSIYEDYDVYNFAITTAADAYEYSKATNLTKSNDIASIDGGYYAVYTATGLTSTSEGGFNTAFYIKGFNAETLEKAGEDSENYTITQYAANIEEDADCLVIDWRYNLGTIEMWSDVVEFKATGSKTCTRTGMSYIDTATQDLDYLIKPERPYFVKNSGSIDVTFYYNLAEPENSLVQVTPEGGSTWTGVDNVIAESEDAPVEYFNLSGVRVDGSIPGLYIRRQGSKVSKVIIK